MILLILSKYHLPQKSSSEKLCAVLIVYIKMKIATILMTYDVMSGEAASDRHLSCPATPHSIREF